MANIYGNAFFNLTTTDKTDVYTCPSDSRAIIQNIQLRQKTLFFTKMRWNLFQIIRP